MALALSVFTVGAGDLLQEVLNAVAAVFNNTTDMLAITHLAVLFGGVSAIFAFSKIRDVHTLVKWAGMYVMVTSLMLMPKATVIIDDRSDSKPRLVANVPLSLAIVASFTSRIGLGLTQSIETVFHMPDDLSYHRTGMLMGSKLILAARHFEITDAAFSQTLNDFMQQCVFYDLLLNRYAINDLLQAENPWGFIKEHTSVARAFPLAGNITVCKAGAQALDKQWQVAMAAAAARYGGQVLGNSSAANVLLARLSDGYQYLTHVSQQGAALLQTHLLANALSQALSHYGATANAPAALQAYQDTKTQLQMRQTLDETGRQAGYWLQQMKNSLEAVLYSAFLFIYFLSYFPFGGSLLKNYVVGMFYLQSLAPMYAVINFIVTFFAQHRSLLFIGSAPKTGLSIADIAGITQANADAMALAGYLTWVVTLGGGLMLFRGLPQALQSVGQYVGGVVQNSASHVIAETVGGNISAGNANFANQSAFNNTAHHVDTNARYASGMATFQTGTGSTVSLTGDGTEVMDNRGALSNLGVSVNVADSVRTAASQQAQRSYSSAITQTQAAGEHYSTALRQMEDYSHQQSHSQSSGSSSSTSQSTGFSHSAQTVSQLVESFAKEHHVNHERAAQVLGQVYADAKVAGGFIVKGDAGASLSASASARASFGSLYNAAERFSHDRHFNETVDSARRSAHEVHYREGADTSNRLAASISRSFDQGDNFRQEAANHYSSARSFSTLASQTQENATSINANYTQEFYEYLRKQPAPYGQGRLSRSAIDNMATHDPALLKDYANRFVNEKTAQTLSTFQQRQGLTPGAADALQQDYQHNHQALLTPAAIETQHAGFENRVNSHAFQADNPPGGVDKTIAQQVMTDMQQDKDRLATQQQGLQHGQSLKDHINDHVKGQVFGSLPVFHHGTDKKEH